MKKSILCIIATLACLSAAQANANEVKVNNKTFSYLPSATGDYYDIKPLNSKDDRYVVLSVDSKFKIKQFDCSKGSCEIYNTKQVGSDLIATIVHFSGAPVDSENVVTKEADVKIGTIRGDRQVDFIMPHLVRLVDVNTPHLACSGFNVPSIGNISNCGGGRGHYDIRLY